MLKAKLERSMRGIWKFTTVAYVGDDEVTSAEMMVRARNQQDVGQGNARVSGIDPRAIVSPQAELAAGRRGRRLHASSARA